MIPFFHAMLAGASLSANPSRLETGRVCASLNEVVFIGGLDARILECGDRERTRDGILEFLDGMRARNARFVYGSDHSLSTNIDYEDPLHALEVCRAHMMN